MDLPSNLPPRVEPAFPIRLLALDIDGTLVGDSLVIGPRTRRAVRAASARGVAVSLVTGRMVSSAMRFARELELTAPIVGYQGGLIREIPPPDSTRLGRLLVHTPLAAAVARDVLVWTREHGLDPHVNHLERFILRADDPRADDYSAFMGARAELVPDIVEATTHPVTKILAVGEPPLPLELARPARARFAGRADVTISHPRFLEFVAPGVSKGRAIRYLSRRLGVPLAATMAIGDQWNDLEMLAEVGHGAAMPTAPLAVRSVARYVAPPVADEGVAAMIEALVLPEPAVARRAADRLADEARRALEPSDAEDVRERTQGRRRGGRRVTVTGDRIVRDDDAGRAAAVEALRNGGIVALPTDTVYGIAAALDVPGGIGRLFAAKRRPPDKAIMLLLADIAQAGEIGRMTAAATALAAACWPGGLTVVVPQRTDVAAARGAHRGRTNHRPAHAGSPRATRPGSRGRPAPDDLRERFGPARGADGGGDPRAARRRRRPRARWRRGARRPARRPSSIAARSRRASCVSARSRRSGSRRSSMRPACRTRSMPSRTAAPGSGERGKIAAWRRAPARVARGQWPNEEST